MVRHFPTASEVKGKFGRSDLAVALSDYAKRLEGLVKTVKKEGEDGKGKDKDKEKERK
jgi:hypothetical protein